MPRLIDLRAIKNRLMVDVALALVRYETAVAQKYDYFFLRWIAKMTAVEIHASWERYAESRLVAALNHNPEHFVSEHDIRGVKRISAGLAFYLVRGGGRYFDFRSMSDLIDKGDRLVGHARNPFRRLSQIDRRYLDTLSAIRNCVVHGSSAAFASYKRLLRSTYSIHKAPEPDEFLNARDTRAGSPARYESRLHGIAAVVIRAITNT